MKQAYKLDFTKDVNRTGDFLASIDREEAFQYYQELLEEYMSFTAAIQVVLEEICELADERNDGSFDAIETLLDKHEVVW